MSAEHPKASDPKKTPVDLVTPEILEKHDRPGPRYTSYPTAVEFSEDFTESDYRKRLTAADKGPDDSISLYIHIPFCEDRCTFCGCNVIITRKPEVSERYLDYLGKEIDLLASSLPSRRTLLQYHWGGGTPTYLSCRQIEALQKKITEHFTIHPDAEVAIEVDPRVTTVEQLRLLRDLGFNRLSMGVQDFTQEVQETVNRVQSVEETRRIVDVGRDLGFGSINIDMIYGLPLQTPETFEKALETVIEMRPERVAVYSFAFVPWIKGNQKSLPTGYLPGREMKFQLFATAIRAFLAAGYDQIGMDHFAVPEDDMARAVSNRTLYRNFMGYTVHKAPDFLGLGVSSIGHVEGAFAQNTKKLSRYYEALDAGRFPVERGYVLNEDDKIRQLVIMELMCNFYVSASAISKQCGIDFASYFATELSELQAPDGPAAQGFLEVSPEGVEVLPLGRLFIRNIAMIFDRYLREKQSDKPVFSRTV
jgi:oxygen-independent coproporphyrinogen-3 oxidase